MTRERWFLATGFAAIALASAGLALAQTSSGVQPSRDPSRYPPALPKRLGPAPPPVAFRIAATLSLPGKVSDGIPTFENERLRFPLEGGRVALVDPATGRAELAQAPSGSSGEAGTAPGAGSAWVEAAEGDRRVRSAADGSVETEHRCGHCAAGWRREWRARLAGAASSEPLVSGERVFVGAMDTMVYGLQLGNGHRLWASDVGERVVLPVVLWSGSIGIENGWPTPRIAVLLVLGQGGGTLTGLDPYDGRKLATLDLRPAEGRFASRAVVLPDGRIAVALETYAKPESELLLLVVERAPEKAPPAAH